MTDRALISKSHPDDNVQLNDKKHERRPSTVAIILDCCTDDSGDELHQRLDDFSTSKGFHQQDTSLPASMYEA